MANKTGGTDSEIEVYSTSRAKSIIMVGAFAVAIGIFIDPVALGIGLTIIMLLALEVE
jgi:hypothetical protein